MMDDDEEAPPLLVAADGADAQDANLSAEMEDVKVTKVPITIITGRLTPVSKFLYGFVVKSLKERVFLVRVS